MTEQLTDHESRTIKRVKIVGRHLDIYGLSIIYSLTLVREAFCSLPSLLSGGNELKILDVRNRATVGV